MADLTMISLCYYCKKQHRKECDKERNILPADSDYSYQHYSHQWVAKCSEFESKYESVRHGKWVGYHGDQFCKDGKYRHYHFYVCSNCGRRTAVKTNFCPDCGCRMDGDLL